jgi:hypothetical protein
MAIAKFRAIAIGDQVSILPRDQQSVPIEPRTAIVVYSGPVYIRLSDASVYTASSHNAIQGNANTRIELMRS